MPPAKPPRRSLLLCSFVLALAGCAKPPATPTTFGQDFNSTRARQFKPGVDTKLAVLSELGRPKATDSFSANKDLSGKNLPRPVAIERVTYYFSDRAAPAAKPGTHAYRSAVFLFGDDTLIDASHRSSFPSEAIDFDEHKVKSLVKGRSKQADVIELFGNPSGTAIYPSAREPGGSAWTYDALSFDKQANRLLTKKLVVFFNRAKVVSHVDLDLPEN